MSSPALSYHGYRFPPDIIGHAVWLYHRFALSLRDVEDLLAQRGVTATYETIRQWCRVFGPAYAKERLHDNRNLCLILHVEHIQGRAFPVLGKEVGSLWLQPFEELSEELRNTLAEQALGAAAW